MGPIRQLIDFFQAAEEVRLLHHQGGHVLAAVGPQGLEQRTPRGAIEIHVFKNDALIAGDRLRHLRIGGIHGPRQ